MCMKISTTAYIYPHRPIHSNGLGELEKRGLNELGYFDRDSLQKVSAPAPLTSVNSNKPTEMPTNFIYQLTLLKQIISEKQRHEDSSLCRLTARAHTGTRRQISST